MHCRDANGHEPVGVVIEPLCAKHGGWIYWPASPRAEKVSRPASCADRGRRLAAARKKAPGKYAGSVLEIGRLAAFESVKWTAEKRGRVETVAT